jgi:GNAT superfamily N-acetyltransferase
MSTGNEGNELRRATPDDAEAVASIWRDGWRDGHLGNVPDELVAARTLESFSSRAAQRVGDTVVFVVGGAVAGFVMVVDDEVEQVYVSSRHRGTGVAAALLDEAERLVRSNGHERAWLAVVSGNARARRFYERMGWTDEGAFDYPAANAGSTIPVPCLRYVKRLDAASPTPPPPS